MVILYEIYKFAIKDSVKCDFAFNIFFCLFIYYSTYLPVSKIPDRVAKSSHTFAFEGDALIKIIRIDKHAMNRNNYDWP